VGGACRVRVALSTKYTVTVVQAARGAERIVHTNHPKPVLPGTKASVREQFKRVARRVRA